MNQGLFKFFFIGIFVLIFVMFGLKFMFISNIKSESGTVYEITVHNYNSQESYTTSSYTKDANSGCLRFKDEFGIKHTVCGQYTISEW